MHRFAILGLVILLAGCTSSSDSFDSGPSPQSFPASSIVIQSETLVPCGGGDFCCVRTQLVNTNTETVDISINWHAFNAQGQSVGFAFDFFVNVGPGATVVEDSQSFSPGIRCDQIARFQRGDVTVVED